ncbi:MAG: GAF domain-containing protein [Planctomycetes bacterium]|nr:GAF domain-containing protein [Planctomycetota bacterium]
MRTHGPTAEGVTPASTELGVVAQLLKRLDKLNAIGIALSSEKDPMRLVEQILLGAKDITNADGGTVYSVTGDGTLRFEMLRNDTLGLVMGGSSGVTIPYKPLSLRREDGSANHASVVAHAVVTGDTVNIPDAYHADGFDFAGTRAFDAKTGYRSTSMLTVPMRNHEGEITGVLQLLNARTDDGTVCPFSESEQRLVESLASQAATALTKHDLIEGMRKLFESFVQLIATAIDEKSPYTGGHCRRVPELTMMLAEAAARVKAGPLAGFSMSEGDRYELHIASWIHDCGKITTPEYVMDKATKLQTIYDRIGLIETRFEIIRRDLEIASLRALATAPADGRAAIEADLRTALAALDEDLAFIRRANTGGEFMKPEDQERIRRVAMRTWRTPEGDLQPLLTDNEVRNLTIAKGTLLPEERAIINHHMTATIKMLESLPYPKHLRRVPEFAGGHHERMDGKGYPKGLTRDQMSVQARVMGIADIFEALTADDRPYKKAMSLSMALGILGRMAGEGHIDPDLFDVFISEGVYLDYAKKHLSPEQMDAVDLAKIPNYRKS